MPKKENYQKGMTKKEIYSHLDGLKTEEGKAQYLDKILSKKGLLAPETYKSVSKIRDEIYKKATLKSIKEGKFESALKYTEKLGNEKLGNDLYIKLKNIYNGREWIYNFCKGWKGSYKKAIKKIGFELDLFEASLGEFVDLIENLSPAISKHKYNIILGDDVCGRIPTLVIGGLMKKIYKENKLKEPKILFLAGGRHREKEKKWGEKTNNYLDYLLKIKKIKPKDNILLVTEYMGTGKSEAKIINMLNKKGFNCDLAPLSMDSSFLNNESEFSDKKEFTNVKKIFKNVDIYEGSQDGPSLFCELYGEMLPPREASIITGIKKIKGEPISHKRKKGELKKDIRLIARKDVKKMIDFLKIEYDILKITKDAKKYLNIRNNLEKE